MIYCMCQEMFSMIKIDLITGFLGSGKTTFIKKYADWLIEHGIKVGILENDFGAVNVDMMLLQDIQSDRCAIETVAGACDADCHRRRFKTKLIAMGMSGYDRVIVEPSGIFDTDEFFDVLREDPLDRWYEIGCVLTVADACLDTELSAQSEYILASQLANAGKVIISKSDIATEEQVEKTVAYLRSVCERCCGRILGDDVMRTGIDELTDEQIEAVSECGYKKVDFTKRLTGANDYVSLYYMNNSISKDTLWQNAKDMFSDEKCGRVYRVKGFIRDEGTWYEFNADRNNISLSSVENGQDIIIVIGEELNKACVDRYFCSSLS